MTTHTHNDRPQPTSPRIPIPANRRLTSLSPATELRIRTLLAWHAGACGLIADEAKDRIARMYFDGTLTLLELRKLASHKVFKECVLWIDQLVAMKGTT